MQAFHSPIVVAILGFHKIYIFQIALIKSYIYFIAFPLREFSQSGLPTYSMYIVYKMRRANICEGKVFCMWF